MFSEKMTSSQPVNHCKLLVRWWKGQEGISDTPTALLAFIQKLPFLIIELVGM